ncbi:MAG: heavy-metal-associated domain-containing protein [Gemmatimonadota bacterium]|nr:heavy-metal-associated domain-containing protein [Gemmatimonadota bacterium]
MSMSSIVMALHAVSLRRATIDPGPALPTLSSDTRDRWHGLWLTSAQSPCSPTRWLWDLLPSWPGRPTFTEDAMQHLTMAISGMSCGGCVSTVRKALDAIPGTHADAVTVGSATVSYDEQRTTPAAIAQAVRDAGYDTGTRNASTVASTTGGARTSGGGCGCGCG